MGLFKKKCTMIDVLFLVNEIKLGHEGPDFDRLRASILDRDENGDIVLEALARIGNIYAKAVPAATLIPAVEAATIIPANASPAVRAARLELTKAFLTVVHRPPSGPKGMSDVEEAIVRLSNNPDLTRIEKRFAIQSLVYTAGFVARNLEIDFTVKS